MKYFIVLFLAFVSSVPKFSYAKKEVCKGNTTYVSSNFICNNICKNSFKVKCSLKLFQRTRCACYNDFALDKKGKCRFKKECPYYKPIKTTTKKPATSKCGKDQVFTRCKPKCIATCKDKYPRCTKECNGSGCVCKPGYVLDAKKKCIQMNKCPKLQTTKKPTTSKPGCGKHQMHRKLPKCMSYCRKNKVEERCLDRKGKYGCVCNKGYYWVDHKCVSLNECKKYNFKA
uniref:TIL domain-containing protein n=2 Tax=Parastrongyloides trichosuri TaxID=131310 RepID=A0A0N4ZGD7_PARTI